MRLPDDPDPPLQINIVPMIDVIFAILAFFVMSTLFLTRSQGLPVNLPNAETAEAQAQTQIVVTIDPQGQLMVDQQPVDLVILENEVRSRLSASQNPLVVINADTDTQHGRVVEVMDRLRQIDGIQLAIATEQP